MKDLATGRETKLVEGQWPDISPDGESIAFMSGEIGDGTKPLRMKIVSLISHQVRDLSTLSGVKTFSPRWSNDGTRIAFEMIDSDQTYVGVLNPLTGDWKNITKDADLGPLTGGIDLDSWAPKDQGVIFHSLQNLYEVALNSTLISKTPIAHLNISSSTRFSRSADRKLVLFDSTISTSDRPENEVLAILDVTTGRVETITPKTIEARDPLFLSSEKELLFTCLKRFERPLRPGICTIGVDGKGLTLLISDGDRPSFASQ